MRKVSAVVFAIVIFLAGCAHARPVNLYKLEPQITPVYWRFDCSFPEEMKAPVREGFQYWDDLVPNTVFEEVQCLRDGKMTVTVQIDRDWHEEDGKARKSTWGTARLGKVGDSLFGGIITLYKPWVESTNESMRVSVARHEVGHIMGFAHSGNVGCLMYKYIDPKSNRWQDRRKDACEAEVKTFRERYGRADRP